MTMSPWLAQAYKLLEAGPLTVEKLHVEMGRFVPPERALAKRTNYRQWAQKKHGYLSSHDNHFTLERRLEVGRRLVTDASLKKARASRNMIFYTENGARWARLPTPAERQAREEWRKARLRAAQLRAWETRRRNGEDTSAMARKSWVTRRKKGDDGSAAGRKSWVTRRQRQKV